MYNADDDRKAFVRFLINKIVLAPDRDLIFPNAAIEDDGINCAATGIFFPLSVIDEQLVITQYGPLWKSLWAGSKIGYLVGSNDYVFFPRWLAELLKEECAMDIMDVHILGKQK